MSALHREYFQFAAHWFLSSWFSKKKNECNTHFNDVLHLTEFKGFNWIFSLKRTFLCVAFFPSFVNSGSYLLKRANWIELDQIHSKDFSKWKKEKKDAKKMLDMRLKCNNKKNRVHREVCVYLGHFQPNLFAECIKKMDGIDFNHMSLSLVRLFYRLIFSRFSKKE